VTNDLNPHVAAFAPEHVALISRAYEKALAVIGGDATHKYLKADLARHIMSLAKAGELDEERLSEQALAALKAEDDGQIIYSGL
jgi:hypothetical protein